MRQVRKINGTAVRIIRESLGVSHGVLAKRAGISPAHLTRIENGQRQCSPEKYRAIAEALAVPLEAITYPFLEVIGKN